MNLLKEKSVNTGSYYCTWCTQDFVLKKKGVKKMHQTSTRDSMSEEFLFGDEVGVLNMFDEDIRGDLMVVIDDGWDVTYNLNPDHCDFTDYDFNSFGSVELSTERFPSFTGTPAERLKKLSDKIKSLGYHGLGLWISPQVPHKQGVGDDAEISKDYWIERLKWSNYADIKYWKIDWGIHESDDEYRKMIYDNAKIYAPNCKIEQAYTISPFDVLKDERDGEWYKGRIKRLAKLQQFADYMRIYDSTMAFYFITQVNRTIELFKAVKEENVKTESIPSMEDLVYGAAALGCTYGAMRMSAIEGDPEYDQHPMYVKPNTELKRTVRWQRIAPPFKMYETDFEIDETIYRDSYFFPDINPKPWPPEVWGTLMVQDSYAGLARNMELPKVEATPEKPFIFSSINPKTNALSVFTVPRSMGGNPIYTFLADVTLKGKSSEYPIGIFGHYKSLTVEFEDDITGKTVYAQDLAADEAVNITKYVTIDKNRITIPGKIIDKVGLTIKEVDTELPGLIVKIL